MVYTVSAERTAVQDLERVWFCLGNELPFQNILAFPQSNGWRRRMKAMLGNFLMASQERLMVKEALQSHSPCPWKHQGDSQQSKQSGDPVLHCKKLYTWITSAGEQHMKFRDATETSKLSQKTIGSGLLSCVLKCLSSLLPSLFIYYLLCMYAIHQSIKSIIR